MVRVLFITTLFLFSAPAWAQEDGSFLENLIEEQLSVDGMQVKVNGFEGVLSSTATLDSLVISDGLGVWLRIEEASLNWRRAALLRGELDVRELSAARIEFLRLPQSEQTLSPEDVEAFEFELPELPVRINVQNISADVIRLGADVIGLESEFMLNGALQLADGSASISLELVERKRDDRIVLNAGFANETRDLRVNLDFSEQSGGIVSKTLGIPDQPSLNLMVFGDAPLDAFVAQITFSSADVERLGGDVNISQAPSGDMEFAANLGGDIRALLIEELRAFFGNDTNLNLSGAIPSTGGVEIDRLDLQSGVLDLSGNAELDARGLPSRLNLLGQVVSDRQMPVPFSGETPAFFGGANLALTFDASNGRDWTLALQLDDIESSGFAAGSVNLTGEGEIDDAENWLVDGSLLTSASELTYEEPELAAAIGSRLDASFDFRAAQGAAFEVSKLDLHSDDVMLSGFATVSELSTGATVETELSLVAGDLSRFSGLANQDLGGELRAELTGSATIIGGSFDLHLLGTGTDIEIGQERFDPFLDESTDLDLIVRRDTGGIEISRLNADNQHLNLSASGNLSSASGAFFIDADVFDISLAEPDLNGPVGFDGSVGWQADGALTISDLVLSGLGARVVGDAQFVPEDLSIPASLNLDVSAEDLSRFAALLDMPLTGAVDLSTNSTVSLSDRWIDGDVDLSASDLSSGIDLVDALTDGQVEFSGSLRFGDDPPIIRRLQLQTGGIELSVNGPENGGMLVVDGMLDNIGRVSPGLSGGLIIDGLAEVTGAQAEDVSLDLRLSGSSGVSARLSGRVFDTGETVQLETDGDFPAALINRFIAPRSVAGNVGFDLVVSGPPELNSVSGTVTMGNGRVSLPSAGTAIEGLELSANISNSVAAVDVSGASPAGGGLGATGSLALFAPFRSELDIDLRNFVLVQPNLYQTSLAGAVSIVGPLAGGAVIGGQIELGETELRVGSQSSASGILDDLQHQGEPRSVRLTRDRAGIIERDSSATVAYPLDLTVSAPDRIFVRGQGLDVELSGALQLGGTTNDVVASGQFGLVRGRLDLLSNRFEITEANVNLRGALDPYLRIVAETFTDDLQIQIILEGLASAPELRFVSSPELPQDEVAAQLLFGRNVSQISALQAAQLVSALRTLSGGGDAGPVSRLRENLNLSDLDLRTTDSGSTELRAGAYLSENLYSEVTIDDEGQEELNLNLDINRNVKLKGRTSSDGGAGIGIFFEKDY